MTIYLHPINRTLRLMPVRLRFNSGDTVDSMKHLILYSFIAACLFALLPGLHAIAAEPGARLSVVDCLLPGQVRQLGEISRYVTDRRPVRTTASECEIRGGEYVALDLGSYEHSVSVWTPLAEKGDASAQNYLGEIHEKGLGVPPDHEAAARWYARAAKGGSARAQVNLAHLYEQGLGVERDPERALVLYREAAGLKDAILIDPGTLESAQQEVRSLRRSTTKLRQELTSVQGELEEARAQLRAREEELKRRILIPGSDPASDDEQQLRDEAATRVERLERQVAAQQRELAAASSGAASIGDTPADLAGPSIELIDPPVTITRGVRRDPGAQRVFLDPDSERVRIVGRVTAPAGLESLTINGREERPDDHYLFETHVAVPGESLRVSIVAKDRRGKQTETQFTATRARTPIVSESIGGAVTPPAGDFGRYYALLIGNNKYENLPDLRTAVRDVREVAAQLRDRYGFEVETLENVNRIELLSALDRYRQRLGPKDNFLLYFAGHGELDRVNERGHWLPVDADLEKRAQWVSNTAVTDLLNVIEAKQIMLIADTCYSGTLTRTGLSRISLDMSADERAHWLKVISRLRSRTVLSSGGLKPVIDGGGGEHSVFARALLDVLRANGGVLEGQRLFREVAARVAYATSGTPFEQMPRYAPIRHAGHEAGDFLLVPRKPPTVGQR